MKSLATSCLYALAFTTFLARPAFAGTLLQCTGDSRESSMALEIDYQNGTVTELSSGQTTKADISDGAVEWSYTSGPYLYTHSLNRYTGVLIVTPHAECTVCPQSSSYSCSVGQKKF